MSAPTAQEENPWMLALGIGLGVVLPLGGLIVALVMFQKGNRPWGAYVLVAVAAGVALDVALLT